MNSLTDSDYDALYAAMKDEMPRLPRDLFPALLARLEGKGVLTVTVTDTEIVVSRMQRPATAVYRVERRPPLH